MKKSILFGLLLSALFIANESYGQKIELQNSPRYSGQKPMDVQIMPKYVPLYVISVKELPSYFVSSEIPESFPRYDGKLSKEKNDVIALEWSNVPENRVLLTEKAKVFVDEKTLEFKKKYNK